MVRTGKRGLVLGASIIGLFCLLWFTDSLYPLWSADGPLDEVMIADQRLLLAEADGKCVLKVLPDNYLLELDVGLPCYFQRMEGMLLIESFPAFSVDRIFAVIGTSLNEETRNSFGLDPSIVCAEKAQGILIDRGQGTLKNPVFRRVLRVVDELLAGLYRHGSKMRVILYDSLCSVAVRPVFRRFKR